MTGAALIATVLSSAVAGFSSISLAMDRHYQDSLGRGRNPGGKRFWLRLGGGAWLAVSLAASLLLQGLSQGWVLWFGALTVAALAVVATLAFWARGVPGLAFVMALIAVLATCLA